MEAEKTRKEIRFAAECYNINIRECIQELEELERIATEYESNKHYIELGKAVEEILLSGGFIQTQYAMEATKEFYTTEELFKFSERIG